MSDERTAVTRRWGKWSQPGVPHLGWVCVEEYDACEGGGDDMIICQMCETTECRFVHVMEHEDWPDRLHCGCVCSAHMAGDKVAAETRDKRMRSRAQRRAKFSQRKGWRVSLSAGTPYMNIEGYHLLIAKKADGTFQVGAKSPLNTRIYGVSGVSIRSKRQRPVASMLWSL
jgi:hypothetical protein